jgi:chaperonin GroES
MNNQSIQPLQGKIIAIPLKSEVTTKSGIVLSGTSEQNRFVKGEVIACATEKYVGEKLVPMTVKVGDIVYFDEYSTREFSIDAEKYYSLTEDNIYIIFKEKK